MRGALLALCAALFFLAPRAMAGREGGRHTPFVVTRDAGGWTIQYERAVLPSATVTVDGAPHELFALPTTGALADTGAPLLPVETVNLGIPFDVDVSVQLTDAVYEEHTGQLVAPVPSYRRRKDGENTPVFRKDPAAYSVNAFSPARTVWSDAPFVLRGQRISAVHLVPAQYNPVTRTLRRLVKGTLHVRTGSPRRQVRGPATAPGGRDPLFEEVFRSLLANYTEAAQWRSSPAAGGGSAAEPTRDWFETGRTYYRVPVAVDGWYRISPSDLTPAGMPPGSVDTASLKLVNRGSEVPLFILPDSSIEFLARRNYGDSTFYDYWTDTNIYWLTWGGPAGQRYTAASPPADTPTVNFTSVPLTAHFEQNTAFYRGASDLEIIQPGPVPGKEWVWEYYYPGTTVQHTFSLDSIDAVTGTTSILRVRLYGTTSGVPPVTHHARFWLNDSLAGDVTFGERQEEIFTATVPTRWLRNGPNTITIQSIDTQTSPNQFYLDWFEIDYRKFLIARGDQLTFTVPAPSGRTVGRFTVSGFTTRNISVFDAAGRRWIFGGQVSGSPSAGFTIVFADSFSASRQYLVASDAGYLRPALLSRKIFTDIRNNPAGADYIIVTHSDFLTAARRLASARQATNGVRTSVVTVQDIFDEFNYGIFNGEKTKAFLYYAYRNWRSPAPASVLLFGDASYDDHHYLPATVKRDFVPSWGVPTSDNWFVCFDSVNTFLPGLLIGRVSFEDSLAADRMVTKLTGYDAYVPGGWDKSLLFVAGGLSGSEQSSFDAISDQLINFYVSPPPIGGRAIRVYKTNTDIIDSTNRGLLQSIVKDGIVFMNYLGHSGGTIWEEDMGNPDSLRNTNGWLPFVSSVSCNVGGFGDQQINTLGENFTRADNRGAIAMWGAVSLGYAYQGTTMVMQLLTALTRDSVRSFGALTTSARLALWAMTGSDPVTVAMVQLTPLLGDPLSHLAIPLLPDLAVAASDLTVAPAVTTVNDTAATVGITVHNYGLVPADSVGITLSDASGGQTSLVLNNANLPPTFFRDSLSVLWRGTRLAGSHTLRVTLDPAGRIPEVTRANNSASIDQYVYGNLLFQIRPLENMVVPPGVQVLRVTNPVGVDSVALQVIFEIDTVSTFTSPFLADSGPISTGPVSTEWSTPPIPEGRVCYWRVRTYNAGATGPWSVFTFSTASGVPSLPIVRWREHTPGLFASGTRFRTVPTDSGVILGSLTTVDIAVRSVGAFGGGAGDYSVVRAGGASITGYPWLLGTGFICARVDDGTGAATFRSFDIPATPVQADSMTGFLTSTPAGNYVCVSVISDGYTYVTPALRSALKSLGSVLIDSVRPNDSWCFIARAGGRGGLPLEHWSRTSVTADSLRRTNYFPSASGSFTGPLLAMPQSWRGFSWSVTEAAGITQERAALLGIRRSGATDTLRFIPKDSMTVDLRGLSQVTSDSAYIAFRAAALLATSDTHVTPVLRDWSAEFEAPPDLAISSRTVSSPKLSAGTDSANSVTVTIYNVGYRTSDSARAVLSALQSDRSYRPIAFAEVDSIPAGSSRMLKIPFAGGGLGAQATLQVRVSPPLAGKDLIQENNTALIRVSVAGSGPLGARMRLFADGVQLMDGDFVAARPKILVRLYDLSGVGSVPPAVDLFVDNIPSGGAPAALAAGVPASQLRLTDDPTFTPVLSNGTHELRFRVSQVTTSGSVDSVTQRLIVNVTDQVRIMQMYNYPDPFGADTWFTFVLTGNTPPEDLTVKIYTVKGRKIRELRAAPGSLQVGFNRLYWDGRDADGDDVANGYYLYQVLVSGGGKSIVATGKLARVR